jgi:hypothetical protein
VRGDSSLPGSDARAGSPITLRVDLTELPVHGSYQLSLVDSQRRIRAAADLAPVQRSLVWGPLPALPPGTYWIRLSGAPPERDLLREYGLRVR